MKTTFEFSVESLLFGIENPKGNIEQVLFAKKLAEHEGIPNCNRLAKLSFADEFVNTAVAERFLWMKLWFWVMRVGVTMFCICVSKVEGLQFVWL
ncbi:hypothetical protein [Chryseobacterium indoltheticum]|uniref:hypothetical protein n=1 Tax=Chryseobacterium indoltheticum TaxID=254 RepID=UPI003F496D50